MNVISKELELSSELNTKHGAIYDSMQNAIFAAIEDAGALSEESETDLAQYVSETSKMFANQVLAEANKRGCLIDDVLKDNDAYHALEKDDVIEIMKENLPPKSIEIKSPFSIFLSVGTPWGKEEFLPDTTIKSKAAPSLPSFRI